MSYEVLKSYLLHCKVYGWKSSYEGIKAFDKQLKQGYRKFFTGGQAK